MLLVREFNNISVSVFHVTIDQARALSMIIDVTELVVSSYPSHLHMTGMDRLKCGVALRNFTALKQDKVLFALVSIVHT